MTSRRWIVRAFTIFCVLLVLWVAFAMVLGAAAEGSLPISMHVYSDLYADYSPDVVVRPIGVFNLAIISETLKDRGYSEEEAQERAKAIEVAMKEPIPTATALNYEGDAPPTATPTKTRTATVTRTPSVTPTETPTAILSKTPSRTPTKEPTEKPIPSKTPTPDPTPSECCKKPVVQILLPDGSPVYGFSDLIEGHAFAYDPDDAVEPYTFPEDDGAGIVEVVFEVWEDGGASPVYTHTEFHSWYCAFPGGVASPPCHTHPVVSGSWPSGGPTMKDGKHRLKVRAKDNEGVWSDAVCASFYLDLPAPTDTPEPTATPTPEPVDTTSPDILPGWSVSPSGCAISLTNLEVHDPFYSSCLDGAWLSYTVNEFGCERVLGPSSTSQTCAGNEGSGSYAWVDKIKTSELQIYEEECFVNIPDETITIRIEVTAKDNAGYESTEYLGSYTLSEECAPGD